MARMYNCLVLELNTMKYKNTTKPCRVAVKSNKYANIAPESKFAKKPNVQVKPNMKKSNTESRHSYLASLLATLIFSLLRLTRVYMM